MPDSNSDVPNFIIMYEAVSSSIESATCMKDLLITAKDFLEDVHKRSSECSHSGSVRPCFLTLIASIRSQGRYWTEIESNSQCENPTVSAVRKSTVAWVNKRRDDVIDALVSFAEHDITWNDRNRNVVAPEPEISHVAVGNEVSVKLAAATDSM